MQMNDNITQLLASAFNAAKSVNVNLADVIDSNLTVDVSEIDRALFCKKTGAKVGEISEDEVKLMFSVSTDAMAHYLVNVRKTQNVALHWVNTSDSALEKLAHIDPVGFCVYSLSRVFTNAVILGKQTDERPITEEVADINALAAMHEILTTHYTRDEVIAVNEIMSQLLALTSGTSIRDNLPAKFPRSMRTLMRTNIADIKAEFVELPNVQRRYGYIVNSMNKDSADDIIAAIVAVLSHATETALAKLLNGPRSRNRHVDIANISLTDIHKLREQAGGMRTMRHVQSARKIKRQDDVVLYQDIARVFLAGCMLSRVEMENASRDEIAQAMERGIIRIRGYENREIIEDKQEKFARGVKVSMKDAIGAFSKFKK